MLLGLPTLAELGSGHRVIPLQRLEHHLDIIPTTATAVEKLKRRAKKLRKESGSSLAVALDLVAAQDGYTSWKHVTQCLENTRSAPAEARSLPANLSHFLDEYTKTNPPSEASRRAFNTGLIFAIDVKEAQDIDFDSVVACDDVEAMVALDIWRVWVHSKDDETGLSLADVRQGEDLLQHVLDDRGNYRLFRYTGDDAPTTIEDAFARVLGRLFFPPIYVWLQGRFIDMAEVRQVKVGGRVIYSSMPGSAAGPATRSFSSSSEQPSNHNRQLEVLPVLVSGMNVENVPAAFRRFIIPRLNIEKRQPGFYEFELTHGGVEMMTDGGFSSIREAIESAADITGDIRGFEVAYAGLVVGTYPLETLRTSAEAVAQQAASTLASLGDRY